MIEQLRRSAINGYWRWRLRGEQVPVSFDPKAYRRLHRDVAAAGIDPLVHYLRFGRYEGRDPGPDFSASGYCLSCPEAKNSPDPLLHYESAGRERKCSIMPELEGGYAYQEGQPVVMVCGHQAGRQLYGAERSLLDLLDTFRALRVNVIATLPSAINAAYISQVRERVWRLAVLPYGWWRAGHPGVPETQRHFERLMRCYSVEAVYVNTLVLDEVFLAARALGIPSAVHVRELPSHDPALRQVLGASEESIAERINGVADVIVTNSRYTADSLKLDPVHVLSNTIDVAMYRGISTPFDIGEPVTVGMIGSNLPKKGLDDFIELARLLKVRSPEVRCRLIGPHNEHVRERQSAGKFPDNVDISGYTDTPMEALGLLDILVNLSHFEESFGRTVLEAMAASRPVVVYRWGALPELVDDGQTGYTVPLGHIEAVADHVVDLASDAPKRQAMGRRAHLQVTEHYQKSAAEIALYRIMHDLNLTLTK